MTDVISFDRVADIYDSTRSLPPEIMDEVVEALAWNLEKKGCRSILDAGVGTGRFALPLQSQGFTVIGIDISPAMLARAQTKLVKNLAFGDLRRMPFRDESFDASLFIHVFHLIREVHQGLAELKRVSRKALFSVVAIFPPQVSLTDLYEKRLLESGWPEIHPGLHERDLVKVIPPTETESIVTYTEERAADDALRLLNQRVYSSLWEVPDELHKSIMAELRAQYAGKTLSSTRELQICVWDKDRI